MSGIVRKMFENFKLYVVSNCFPHKDYDDSEYTFLWFICVIFICDCTCGCHQILDQKNVPTLWMAVVGPSYFVLKYKKMYIK